VHIFRRSGISQQLADVKPGGTDKMGDSMSRPRKFKESCDAVFLVGCPFLETMELCNLFAQSDDTIAALLATVSSVIAPELGGDKPGGTEKMVDSTPFPRKFKKSCDAALLETMELCNLARSGVTIVELRAILSW